jgi:GT2 family glycosyltransferase
MQKSLKMKGEKMEKIVAVVVTYNRKELLKENLNSLLEQTYKDFEILLIDNASTDGTKEYVKEEIENEKVIYINTGKNLGGAGGFNFGVKEAIERGYDYAWLMDDDTIPTKTALESLVNKTEVLNNEFSFLSSLCKWTDGSVANMNKQVITQECINEYDKVTNNLLLVERASFVSFYVNLEVAKKVGLPYKEFFIYGDDWEYCLRLNTEKPGYLDIDSVVIHKMASNEGVSIYNVGKDRIKRNYFNYRNLTFAYRKISKKSLFKYLGECCYQFVLVPFKAKDHRFKRMWTIVKGNVIGLFFNPKIEYAEVKNKVNKKWRNKK